MADRYWVGGTATWDGTAGSKWAATSGGAGGQSVPTAADDVFFDGASGAGTVTIGSSRVAKSINCTGFTGTLGNSSNAITISGSVTLVAGMTYTHTGTMTFNGTGTLTTAGKTFSGVEVNGSEITVTLGDALDISTRSVTVTLGTFNTANYNVTANQLSSSNSNFRSIILGSSTVTLSNTTPIVFTTFQNLTFNAGTSQINCSGTSCTFNGATLTYYNVAFTATATSTHTINQVNIFNDLSVTAPSANAINVLSLTANQTISGTLTVAGASAVRRVAVYSSVIPIPRTLTVGTLSATDCDFRSITIAGTAAGSSPTRAGDCRGNTGITFPAPKTVYWNLSGSQNWSANAWASSSGGSPAVDNFPLAQDTAVFDEAGSAGTITLDFAWNIGTFNASARTSAMTLSGSATPSIYGSWTFGTGVTSSNTGTFTFLNRGTTSTITSNGVTFGCAITITCMTGKVQLGDALSLAASRTLSLTSGTFDAVTYNVTVPAFSMTQPFQEPVPQTETVPQLYMGSGLWTLSGTGTVWSYSYPFSGNLLVKGTSEILLSDNSVTSRTFNTGGAAYGKITIGGTSSTSTTTISGGGNIDELASTKTVAHTISLSSATTFGKWSVTGTSGNAVTISGSVATHILAGDATSGIDYLIMGSTGFAATSPGEFYAGANSTGTAGAPVFRTAPPAGRTLYWVGGTGNWNDTARWSLSSGGAGGEAVPTSLDNVIFDSGSNATGYTATVNQITGGNRCKALTIAGPASGNLTLAGTVALFIHDDITLPATGLTRTYTGAITLSSNQTGRTITRNGASIASAITVNGVGCEWTLADAFTTTGGSLRVTNGTLKTDNYNLNIYQILLDGGGTRVLDLGSSAVTTNASYNGFFDISSVAFSAGELFGQSANASILGTSTITNVTTGSERVLFYPNGAQVYNVVISGGGDVRISSGTFNNLTVNGAGGINLLMSRNNNIGDVTGYTAYALKKIIVNGTLTIAPPAANNRRSLAPFGGVSATYYGDTFTLDVNTLVADNCDFRDISLIGNAAGTAPTRAGDLGGNTGIVFPAPKTVYRVGTNTSWAGSSSWATTSGGAGSNDNYPLAQDTAVIDNATTLTGTLNFAGIFGSVDASTRTTGITFAWFGTVQCFGSFANGSGVTNTSTERLLFNARGSTVTFTSAGKTITFPIYVNTINGTFRLGDSFTSTASDSASTGSLGISFNAGTFDTQDYNLTCTRFLSLGTTAFRFYGSFVQGLNARTIDLGSSTVTLTATGTVWDTPESASYLTPSIVSGTSEIVLSNTTSTARTFSSGPLSYNKLTIGGATGTSTLTMTGFGSFSEIASTKTVAHTITFATNQNTIGTWSVKGTSGNVVTVNSSSAGTRRTFSLTNAIDSTTNPVNFLSVRDIGVNQANRYYVGENSTNVSNNFNVIFTSNPPAPPSGGNMFLLFT